MERQWILDISQSMYRIDFSCNCKTRCMWTHGKLNQERAFEDGTAAVSSSQTVLLYWFLSIICLSQSHKVCPALYPV